MLGVRENTIIYIFEMRDGNPRILAPYFVHKLLISHKTQIIL